MEAAVMEDFFRLLCENREEAKKHKIYWIVIEKYPFELMRKLLSTVADENASPATRESAALFIHQELIHVDDEHGAFSVIEELYPDIDAQSLDFLRQSAVNLMIGHERNSVLQTCGEHMAMALARSWLETEAQEWDGFLDFVEEGFTAPPPAPNLDIFLSIFRGLHHDSRVTLLRRVQPRVERNRARFEAAVLQMLRDARDDSPFLILPCIILAFDQPLPPAFLRGAIMSDLFQDITSYPHHYMDRIALILLYCVENSRPFEFPTAAMQRLEAIIRGIAMLRSSELARQLRRVFRNKIYTNNNVRRCRPRRR